jgi:hypothetical protein
MIKAGTGSDRQKQTACSHQPDHAPISLAKIGESPVYNQWQAPALIIVTPADDFQRMTNAPESSHAINFRDAASFMHAGASSACQVSVRMLLNKEHKVTVFYGYQGDFALCFSVGCVSRLHPAAA